MGDDPGVVELVGFEPGSEVVAIVYLGWPAQEPAVPERPPITVHKLGD